MAELFTATQVRSLINKFHSEEITFSRLVECLNEHVVKTSSPEGNILISNDFALKVVDLISRSIDCLPVDEDEMQRARHLLRKKVSLKKMK